MNLKLVDAVTLNRYCRCFPTNLCCPIDSVDCLTDNGIQLPNKLPQIDHCCHWCLRHFHLHFEMMSNLNCCPTIASDLSSKLCYCRCNYHNRLAVPDRERFAQMSHWKQTIDVEINVDAIDANCWQSIVLHSTEPVGCHIRLKLNWNLIIFNIVLLVDNVNETCIRSGQLNYIFFVSILPLAKR